MSEPVVIPAPPVALDLADLDALSKAHGRTPLALADAGGTPRALGGDRARLVDALLDLGLEALLIHQAAEAQPHRPVSEVLAEVAPPVRLRQAMRTAIGRASAARPPVLGVF